MKTGYRDRLIMHAFHPSKAPLYNPTAMRTLHFYACLFELADMGRLRIEENRIICSEAETGDEVLDKVIGLISPLSGKKAGRLQMLVSQKAGPVFKLQLGHMTDNMYLKAEDINFLFWTFGKNYRVIKYDLLKPSIKAMERSLVYGRDPDRETWLTILLVGEAGLFRNIFSVREFRQRAKNRFSELLESELHDDYTISVLHKNLRKTLAAQKAAKQTSKKLFT
jgi:hypothetical protein